MHMPEFNGLEVQHQLAGNGDALSVIFLTAHGQIDQCVGALKSGALDFLTNLFQTQVSCQQLHWLFNKVRPDIKSRMKSIP